MIPGYLPRLSTEVPNRRICGIAQNHSKIQISPNNHFIQFKKAT